MLFNTLEFALFFAVVYCLYLACRHRWQNRILLLASYVFYGCWDWRCLVLILFSTAIDFVCGAVIYKTIAAHRKRSFLLLSICSNLGVLCFFKYFNFFADGLQALLHCCGFALQPITLNIILPVGISFYTFKTLSYTFDIYRGEMRPADNFFDYALFVSFFPNILAGPIDRAKDFLPQITSPRNLTLTNVYEGAYLIFWGLFQKLFVADNLHQLTSGIFGGPRPYNGADALLATLALPIQIFCDFDGYSNIARGIGKCLGFEMMINFNMPFTSRSVTELWRRYHISLSTWFRDYVYSPLAISKRYWGIWGPAYALCICFLLIGLWHGAEWKFMVFGLLQGVVLSYEMATRKRKKGLTQWLPLPARMVAEKLSTFVFFSFCCIFIQAADVSHACRFIHDMLFHFTVRSSSLACAQAVLFFALPMVLMQLLQSKKQDLLAVLQLPAAGRAIIYFVMYYLLVVYGVEGGKEFMYFQF